MAGPTGWSSVGRTALPCTPNVWPTRSGERSRPQGFRLTLHGLRHTYATLALRAGVHPKVVQEVLGHANVGITLDRYSHAVPALEQEAAARVAALIFGPGG
jgi:integrase